MQGDDLVRLASCAETCTSHVSLQLARAHYDQPHMKVYYVRCPVVGRDGRATRRARPTSTVCSPARASNCALPRSGCCPNLASSALGEAASALMRGELLRKCDGLNGLRDGLIVDPYACQFVPKTLFCARAVLFVGEAGRRCAQDPRASRWRHGEPCIDHGAIDDQATSRRPYAQSARTPKCASARGPPTSWSSAKGAARCSPTTAAAILSFPPEQPNGITSTSRGLALPIAFMYAVHLVFAISGMDHCGRGLGAWMFGQSSKTVWSNSSDASAFVRSCTGWRSARRRLCRRATRLPRGQGCIVVTRTGACGSPTPKDWVCA